MVDGGWELSRLPHDVLAMLEEPRSLGRLAEALAVTDARVLWYLEKLRDAGRVVEDDGLWRRTASGAELADAGPVLGDDCTVLPGRTVHDFVQAYADAAAGMFGETYVQASSEHAGRVPYSRVVEFNERLTSLIAEYFAPDQVDPKASPKYAFHWTLTPADLHPLTD